MGPITFRRLEVASFCHSLVYLSLLVCAFILSNPQPETFMLGLEPRRDLDRDVADLHRGRARRT